MTLEATVSSNRIVVDTAQPGLTSAEAEAPAGTVRAQ